MPSLISISEMNKPVRVACVVMASGMSRRFGSNKLLAPFAKKPLLQWTLQKLQGRFDSIIVVTRHAEIHDLCQKMRIPCLMHNLPHRSDTIRLGLQSSGRCADGCMFCPGDQPLLSEESISDLLNAFYQNPLKILRFQGGMPAIFPAWTFDELCSLSSGAGGSALMKKYPESVLDVPPRHPRELLDTDTPEALLALEKIFLEQSDAEAQKP